jgi:hypothetical protein
VEQYVPKPDSEPEAETDASQDETLS